MTDHLHDRVDQAIGKALDDDPMHNLTDLQQRLTATVLAALLATGTDREQRIRLDDLTSNDLDDLYDDLDRYAEILGEMNERLVHLEQRADQLAVTLDDVLRHFIHKGHPGEPCLQTGWISERTVARWRETLYQPTPAPAATEATGP